MRVLILTGPTASGKNTVGQLTAEQLERCAIVDVDLVRWMVRMPHKAPWEGAEGARQQRLGVSNACLLAKKFVSASYSVVILDVLTNATVRQYRTDLESVPHKIVMLLPTFVEARRRSRGRGERLTVEEEQMIYDWQQQLADVDEHIDNTALTAEMVVSKLVTWLQSEQIQ